MLLFQKSGDGAKRIRHPRITAVNGKVLAHAQEHADLSAGRQNIDIRYAFPNTKELHSQLCFQSKADRVYRIHFDAFPPSNRGDLDAPLGTTGWEGTGGPGDGLIILLFLPLEIGLRLIGDALPDGGRVDWAYIDIISSDPAEGVVQRIRVEAK